MKNKRIPYKECHKEIDGVLFKKCNQCNEWFPCNTDYFYKHNKNTSDGLFPNCKTCEKKRSSQWARDNYDRHSIYTKRDYIKRKDKYIESSNKQRKKGNQKIWRQNNPDKIKDYRELYSNKAHNITPKEWISCKEYFSFTCAYCGMSEEEHKQIYNQQLHKEHVNCDGEGDLQNCVPSCKPCNTSKHTENMEEWYKRQEFFNKQSLEKIYKWRNKDYEQYIMKHEPRKK